MKYLTKPIEVEAYQYDGDFGRLLLWMREMNPPFEWVLSDLGELVEIEVDGYSSLIDEDDWLVIYKDRADIYEPDEFHKLHQPA